MSSQANAPTGSALTRRSHTAKSEGGAGSAALWAHVECKRLSHAMHNCHRPGGDYHGGFMFTPRLATADFTSGYFLESQERATGQA